MMLGEEHDKTRKFWPCQNLRVLTHKSFVLLAQIEKIVLRSSHVWKQNQQ